MKKYIIIIIMVFTLCLVSCKEKTVSVTLNLDGGTLNEPLEFTVKEKGTYDLPTPEKPGYRFVGWFTKTKQQYDKNTKFTEDVRLYAKWEEATYTITYNLSDDEKLYTLDDYTYENVVNNFLKDYGLFSKLAINKENFYKLATKPLFTDNGMFTDEKMVEKWNWFLVYIKSCSASYVSREIEKGLLGSSETINEKYIFQEIHGFLNKTKATNYSKTNPSANYADETVINGYKNILEQVYIQDPTEYKLGEEHNLNIPIKEGQYNFIGWSCNGKIIDSITEDMYGDLVLTPVWEGPYYEIEFNLNGGQFKEYFNIYQGSDNELELPTPVKSGLVFMGWFDEEGTRYYSLAPNTTGNLSLTAKWGKGYCYVSYYNYDNTLIEKVEVEIGKPTPYKPLGEYAGLQLEWFNNDNIYDFNQPVNNNMELFARWAAIEEIIDKMYPENITDGLNIISEYTVEGKKIEIFWESASNFINVYSGEVRRPSANIDVKIQGEFSIGNEVMYHSFTIPLEPIVFESLEGKQVSFGYFANYLTNFDENDVVGTVDVIINGFARVTSSYSIDMSEIRGSLNKLLAVREKGVRVLLCTGAYGAACKVYSDAASTEEGRKILARNLVAKVVEFGFDGIDIDWEYPGYETGRSVEVDRVNYTLLMQEIRDQLDEVNPNYLLTAAIPGGSDGWRRYELKKLNKIFDYIQLMTYDLQSSSKVSHHTPLLYNDVSTVYGSVSTTIQIFTREGVSANKLVVGIAFYGRVYELSTAPTDLKDLLGWKYIKKVGDHLTYSDIYKYYIAKAPEDPTIHVLYDEIAKAPYIYDEDAKLFISYDDPTSVLAKCNYAKENNLGGVMFWEYYEDNTKQLLGAIKQGMKS